jgi:hypothetical protein
VTVVPGTRGAGTLAAQTFIQMSDSQFGMFTKNASFEHETVNLEFAIASADRLKPALVVITGDLINDPASVGAGGRVQAHHGEARPEDLSETARRDRITRLP